MAREKLSERVRLGGGKQSAQLANFLNFRQHYNSHLRNRHLQRSFSGKWTGQRGETRFQVRRGLWEPYAAQVRSIHGDPMSLFVDSIPKGVSTGEL